MKAIKTLLITLMLLIVPVAFAQEVEDTDPGVTPDSSLWGLDRAIEKIGIALTFDKGKKVEKRLAVANERLAEVRAMLDKNDTESTEKAENAREEETVEIESELEQDGGIPEDIKAKVLLNLQKHITVLQEVKAKLEEKGLDAHGIDNAITKSSLVIDRFQQKPTQPAKNESRNETGKPENPGNGRGKDRNESEDNETETNETG